MIVQKLYNDGEHLSRCYIRIPTSLTHGLEHVGIPAYDTKTIIIWLRVALLQKIISKIEESDVGTGPPPFCLGANRGNEQQQENEQNPHR
jgi:hypothetical protein